MVISGIIKLLLSLNLFREHVQANIVGKNMRAIISDFRCDSNLISLPINENARIQATSIAHCMLNCQEHETCISTFVKKMANNVVICISSQMQYLCNELEYSGNFRYLVKVGQY